ncbi:MAG: VWA domain-containing protein, partial [Thermoguttaceae bacterium]
SGSGLLFTGGKSAYALGGYFKSPLDEIMPVSMELRQDHRKLSLAIVAVLDRSGSMAMPASGGRSKMDLANIATADLLKILTPVDEIGVIAVDSVPHTVVDLHPNNSVDRDRSNILRVESMGGGIFVYTGLRAAVEMMRKSSVGTKHIILFADATDAEEPGEYRALLAACEKAGITCSVIGLGFPTDCDAEFLRDVARRGNGQCYFTNEPTELPRFFAQDTFVISRSTFIEEPVEMSFTGAITTLLGRMYPEPPQIGGYNLCYLKQSATLSAESVDDYKAPLLASWQVGLGRVACLTMQADGQFTGKIADWDEYPSFLASLGRWTAGRADQLSNNMMLSQEVVDGSLRIRLDLDPEREEASLDALPTITILKQTASQPIETDAITMRWLEPQLLGAIIPLTGSETVLATVKVGESVVSLPPVCLPYSPEYRPAEAGKGRELLAQLAESTGGSERVELTGIWSDIPKMPRYIDVAQWLLYAAILIFTLEIFERRTGWFSAWLRRAMNRLAELKPVLRKAGAVVTDKAASATPDPTISKNQDFSGTGKQMSWFKQILMNRSRIKSDKKPDLFSQPTDESGSAIAKNELPKESTPVKTGMIGALDKAKRSARKRVEK